MLHGFDYRNAKASVGMDRRFCIMLYSVTLILAFHIADINPVANPLAGWVIIKALINFVVDDGEAIPDIVLPGLYGSFTGGGSLCRQTGNRAEEYGKRDAHDAEPRCGQKAAPANHHVAVKCVRFHFEPFQDLMQGGHFCLQCPMFKIWLRRCRPEKLMLSIMALSPIFNWFKNSFLTAMVFLRLSFAGA